MERNQYVNSPAGDRSNREQQRGNSPSGRSKILLFVGLSFGLLCIIQTAINVSVQLQAVECSNSSDHDPTRNITRMSDSDIRDLILERDQLLRDKDQLKQDKDQLIQDKDRLKREKYQLKREKYQLLREKDQLNRDKGQLECQKDQLLQEKDQLECQKDQLLQEKDQLECQKDQLLQEKDQLLQERGQLLHQRDHLVRDNNQLKQEKDQLLQERGQLLHQRDHLVRDNNQLKQEKDRLIEDNRMLNEKIREQQIGQAALGCPPGWWPYKSACYLLSTETNTWDYAKHDCEMKGAHLVVFNNHAEEAVLSTFGCSLEMWMGLRCRGHLTTWECTLEDGSPLHYANWKNLPYPYWFQNVVCAYADKGSSCWNNWFWGSCQDRRFWMCEMKQRNICS